MSSQRWASAIVLVQEELAWQRGGYVNGGAWLRRRAGGGVDGWQCQLLNVGVLQIHKEQNQMTK
jgi:hypothetical protein